MIERPYCLQHIVDPHFIVSLNYLPWCSMRVNEAHISSVALPGKMAKAAMAVVRH
jgi:hypothetical protein